jgi:thiol-disulfide isomerase/thioredoxin
MARVSAPACPAVILDRHGIRKFINNSAAYRVPARVVGRSARGLSLSEAGLMYRLGAGLLVALLAGPGLAEDKTLAAPSDYKALKKEYDEAREKFTAVQKELLQAYRTARTAEDRTAVLKKLREQRAASPLPAFADRFLAFAEKNPKSPDALEALTQALTLNRARGKGSLREKVIAQMRKHHVKNEKMEGLARRFYRSTDSAVEELLQAVARENPHRKAQARAYRALAKSRAYMAQMAERLHENEKLQASYRQALGKDLVEKLLALDVKKVRKEAEKYAAIVQTKYSDVLPDLSPGHKAPEVVSVDLQGKKVKLSDLKGKVVLLDIWATWCGPCRAMIPHERELTQAMKGKPFVLVSVSVDEEKGTVKEFLAKNPMPWTHWWNGARGGIIDAWEVEGYPTAYVIDAQGVIREMFLGFGPETGKKLDAAVKKAVADAERKTSRK